jgi:hypothetical protein
MFEFQSVRRSFPRNLAENSEAASFLGQTTSYQTEVQEREPWDFYEWITCKEKPRCAFEKRGVVEKRGDEETKSMPHAPVNLGPSSPAIALKYLTSLIFTRLSLTLS